MYIYIYISPAFSWEKKSKLSGDNLHTNTWSIRDILICLNITQTGQNWNWKVWSGVNCPVKTRWEVTCRECVMGLCVPAQRCSSCLQYICHRAEIRWWRSNRFLLYLKMSAPIQRLSSLAEGFVLHYKRINYIHTVESFCRHPWTITGYSTCTSTCNNLSIAWMSLSVN